MPTQRYLRLTLDRDRSTLRRGPLAGPRAGLGVDTDRPGLTVETVDLSARDVLDAEADDTTAALAKAEIPLRLIAPLATAEDEAPIEAAGSAAWGIGAVRADASTYDGAGVRVAVLDTGCDAEHPAFDALRTAGRIVGWNFTDGPDDAWGDPNGHGTHCAGTICGGDVGGVRIGVARNVDRLIVGKVLGPGGGSNETLVSAIQWAVEEGAQVISMSLGIDFPGWVDALVQSGAPVRAATSIALRDYGATVRLFQALADTLEVQGTLVIAASGNESQHPNLEVHVAPPAASPGFVSVGAVGQGAGGTLSLAPFSNVGCDLVGPGVGVLSARAGGQDLVRLSGTSMATPHVAGVAALHAQKLMAQLGQVTHAALEARLLGTADLDGLDGTMTAADRGIGIVQAP